MPVSHLGLTVSHIPSSTSFYLAALAPLGYRFIGQRGDSVGLGIDDADFFLSQDRLGSKISPTHIAFTAEDTLAVRKCYTAALNAGGRPSGSPRDVPGDCGCYNAAVIDLDGNTVEFIHREPMRMQSIEPAIPHERPRAFDDTQSVASRASKAQSRARTALDLASSVSSRRSSRPPSSPSISRSRTEPVQSGNGSKNLVGTLLGAAAGAAVAYAMVQSERDSARDEADYARSRTSSSRGSRPPSSYERSMVSRGSVRRSKSVNRGMLAIERGGYSDDEFDDLLSRYTPSRRPVPSRIRTYDAIEYAPASRVSDRSDRFNMRRASTLPNDPLDYTRGSQTAPTSRRTSRRGSLEEEQKLKRHDSAVSMGSRNSRRSAPGERYSSISKTSTVKPAKRSSTYDSAAGVPLPSSKSPSYVTATNYPLPSSRATSYASALQDPPSRSRRGYIDSADDSDGLGDTRTVLPEDSISCVDFSSSRSRNKGKPSSKNPPKSSSKRSSEANNSKITAFRPKPTDSRISAQTAPGPSREDFYGRGEGRGKRSHYSYA